MFEEWILGHDFDPISDNEEIGVKGIPSGNLNSGIGFIIIPNSISIDTYKEDVYRSGRVSIYGGLGHSYFHNVPVDREVLQRIRFPKQVGEYGTPVVWVNIPKHNTPVIVACLKYDDDFHQLQEFQKKITKTTENGDVVEIDMNPAKSMLTFSVNANSESKPQMIFKLNGKNNDGQFILDINGEVIVRSENRIVQIATKTIEMAVTGIDDKVKSRLVLNSAKSKGDEIVDRLIYQDEFNNLLKVNEKRIQIDAADSSRIVFGKDEDKTEPMVKGNTMVSKLESIIDAINALTVPTAFGPSGVPINATQFTQIKEGLKDVLSELTNTD